MAGRWSHMAMHAAAAAAFFFVLQRFLMKESMEISLLWSAVGAVGAALLAWYHTRG